MTSEQLKAASACQHKIDELCEIRRLIYDREKLTINDPKWSHRQVQIEWTDELQKVMKEAIQHEIDEQQAFFDSL